ncbi:MAG: DUF3078 domain-containing protein [Muribaculaceae bacterium]|nr:DUF3078 domain-containing protein [Muribaculaceae bacterium]
MNKKLLIFSLFLVISITAAGRDSLKLHNDSLLIIHNIVTIPTVILADSSTYIPDTIVVEPSIMYMPIIFEKQRLIEDTIAISKPNNNALTVDDNWLRDAINRTRFRNYHINRVIVNDPELVKLNISMLPEPPKQYAIKSEPNKLTLTLEELVIKETPKDMPSKAEIKAKSWINSFNAIVQFSQAYLSSNWYQGGNSSLNLLGHFVFNSKLNQNVHPKLLFESTIQYKIGLTSAPQDTLRSYSISEDLFQINSRFGIKAANKWFYTAAVQFKTQVFNNYTVNTKNLKAAFLTPGELNLGLGMTYNSANKRKTTTLDLSFAPISYNMKISRDERVNETTLGIEEGRKIASQIGSNIECKFTWQMHTNISLVSRLYAFTNYEYVQGDFENTINFSINKFLSTQIYVHLRYDSSADIVSDWKRWQLKEILSFGFNYKI